MCMISDDLETYKVYRCYERRARKSHICTECWRRIKPGESYTEEVGLGDQWDRFATCRHCRSAGRWLGVVCSGYPLTMLGDELDEHRPRTGALLDELHDAFLAKWDSGAAPVPVESVVVADARAYLAKLAAA